MHFNFVLFHYHHLFVQSITVTVSNCKKIVGQTTARQFLTLFSASAYVQPVVIHIRPTLPAQHVRPSGFFCCWSDCLELAARRHAGSEVFCGQLQTVAEDIFIFAGLVCSAH